MVLQWHGKETQAGGRGLGELANTEARGQVLGEGQVAYGPAAPTVPATELRSFRTLQEQPQTHENVTRWYSEQRVSLFTMCRVRTDNQAFSSK